MKHQVISVMTADEGRWAAAAGRGFTEDQLAILARHNVTALPFPGTGVHAERQLVEFAKNGDLFHPNGVKPRSLAASKVICSGKCRPLLQNAGAKLVSLYEAVWN